MSSPPRPSRTREFFEVYTQGLTADELHHLFTRDAREAYRFFARGIDFRALEALPWHRRLVAHFRLFLLAYSRKLPPARRLLFAVALVSTALGLIQAFDGFATWWVPVAGPILAIPIVAPAWVAGAAPLIFAVVLLNLLVLLEVADRLSLKGDLEIARQIQQAMLPADTYAGEGFEASGFSRPANTVGGDFYDIARLPDGRVLVALGDVAGKGSPAALLMALLLAMLRTLVDETDDVERLAARLNRQVCFHAPPSRFITLFLATYDPASGFLRFVNAGQTPPILLRAGGRTERLMTGGVALGLFSESRYEAGSARLEPGDLLVLYSDGITEAEDPSGRPFDEAGLERVLLAGRDLAARELGAAVLRAVDSHTRDARSADDLTMLALRRLAAPSAAVFAAAAGAAGRAS